MKKICAALLALAVAMLTGVCALAGAFDGYWDFEQADGTYAYAFPRVKVTLDKDWYQKTRVELGEGDSTASFYHRASYDAYAAQGVTGGWLFTIGASVNTDFQNLPHFVYLGFDEEEAMNYYAELPTDYQAYMEDASIRAEYDALWSGVEDVLASIQIKGSAEDAALPAAEDAAQPRIVSSGDYDYLIDGRTAAIAKYNGDDVNVTVPSEINEYQVTGIEAEAFRYRKLKRVSIPGSIRSIGKKAFEYCEITDSLELPVNVTIAQDAFSYATLPAVVTIPAGSTVEKCAFSYCEEMERLCIEPNVTLRGRAFDYCDDLKQVVCADGCRLEANAFELCRRLEQAWLCGDVSAEEDAFFGCVDAELIEGGNYDALKQSALDGSLGGHEDDVPELRVLEILDSPATLDGVTATLDRATAERNPETGGFRYTLTGTLENNSDEGIMRVVYSIALIDEQGEEFRSFGLVYDGEDAAMPPHTSMAFNHDDIRWGKQSIPAAVKIGISSVKTETELPPAHKPRTGEYLYQALGDEKLAHIKEQPPVELSFHVDQGGYGRTATFKSGASLNRAIELLCAIKIGEESGEWVTDNYNGIWLLWEDGSHTGISLNLYNLEYSVHSNIHTYGLENLGDFWSYCADYLEED